MSIYIDADGFFETFSELDIVPYNTYPSTDVRENIRGEWTDHRTWEHDGEFYCSNCGFVLDSYIQGAFYNYCPNCGADMRTRLQGTEIDGMYIDISGDGTVIEQI